MALTRVTSGGIAPGVQITFDQNNNPASPAVTFEGTAGTGMYSPANNQLAFATGGVERFKIDGNGNITLTQSAILSVTDNERVVYVSKNDTRATDSETNNGSSINRPFVTIERALVEVARRSYVPGAGDEVGEFGADDFEKFSIIIFPGEYYVDNRPGLGNPAGIVEGTLGDLYRYNSTSGGLIVPRGTSLIGLDLRKTVIRPKYVSSENSATEVPIFKLTGGTYIWQLTIKDPAGPTYVGSTSVITNFNTNPSSVHKVVAFKFASANDLTTYYNKVNAFDPNIPVNSGGTTNYFIQRLEENRIVGQLNNNNKALADTVSSASPYIFNCSLRSVHGLSGLHADGADVTGFKSVVVAQFTGISLQKNSTAFVKNGISSAGLQNDPNASYKDDYRHYHIKASNDAFIQIVSVFAVGYADHFVSESGGDMSITNSNSNFGNTSLRAKGYKSTAFSQDSQGTITAVIPPRGIESSDVAEFQVGYPQSFQFNDANLNNANYKRIYFTNDIKESDIPEFIENEGAVNEKRWLKVNESYLLGKSAGASEKIYLKISDVVYEETLRATSSGIDGTAYTGDSNNAKRQYYGWDYTSTVNGVKVGKLWISVNRAPSNVATNSIIRKLFERQDFDGDGIATDYTYSFGVPAALYIQRLVDGRSSFGLSEFLWRVEYTIPSSAPLAKAPDARFVLQRRDGADINETYYVYDVQTQQAWKQGDQNGIYYITLLRGNIGESGDFGGLSQNISFLYPEQNLDVPDWNPKASTSIFDSSIPGSKISDATLVTDGYDRISQYNLTRETINNFLTSFGNSSINTNTPYATTAENTYGKNVEASARRIALSPAINVEFRRPSIIRASSHTWEYVGFGPGNYSTSFPNFQTVILTNPQKTFTQSREENGGFSASTGTNSDGDFYIGNQIIDTKGNKSTTVNVPKLLSSAEARQIDYSDTFSQINNAINEQAVTFNNKLQSLGNTFSTQTLTATQSANLNTVTIQGSLQFAGSGFNNMNSVAADALNKFPIASQDKYGFAKRTTNVVADIPDQSGYVTPADLEAWRISKGILTSGTSGGDSSVVYVAPSEPIYITKYVNGSVAKFAWSRPSLKNENQAPTPNNIQYTTEYVEPWGGSINDYLANPAGYTPNPEVAKEAGINESTKLPNKIFKPLSSLQQVQEWATKNGFGPSNRLTVIMMPGLYTTNCNIQVPIIINGAFNRNQLGTQYAGLDQNGNEDVSKAPLDSVVFIQDGDPRIAFDGPNSENSINGLYFAYGPMYFNSGAQDSIIQNVVFWSTEQYEKYRMSNVTGSTMTAYDDNKGPWYRMYERQGVNIASRFYAKTSGATTSGSTTIAFTSATSIGRGLGVSGVGIPDNTFVGSITSATISLVDVDGNPVSTIANIPDGSTIKFSNKLGYPNLFTCCIGPAEPNSRIYVYNTRVRFRNCIFGAYQPATTPRHRTSGNYTRQAYFHVYDGKLTVGGCSFKGNDRWYFPNTIVTGVGRTLTEIYNYNDNTTGSAIVTTGIKSVLKATPDYGWIVLKDAYGRTNNGTVTTEAYGFANVLFFFSGKSEFTFTPSDLSDSNRLWSDGTNFANKNHDAFANVRLEKWSRYNYELGDNKLDSSGSEAVTFGASKAYQIRENSGSWAQYRGWLFDTYGVDFRGDNYRGFVKTATSTSFTLDRQLTTNVTGSYVKIVSGDGKGQVRKITAHNTTTNVVTIDTGWTTTPTSIDSLASNTTLTSEQKSVKASVYIISDGVGRVQSASSNTIVLDSNANGDTNHYPLYFPHLKVYDELGNVQVRTVTGYDASTKTITVHPNFSSTPNNTFTYEFCYLSYEWFRFRGTSNLGTFYPDNATAVITGTLAGSSSTTVVLDAGASSVDDTYNGMLIKIAPADSSRTPQQAVITDYVGSTKTATIAHTWKNGVDYRDADSPIRNININYATPASGDSYTILGKFTGASGTPNNWWRNMGPIVRHFIGFAQSSDVNVTLANYAYIRKEQFQGVKGSFGSVPNRNAPSWSGTTRNSLNFAGVGLPSQSLGFYNASTSHGLGLTLKSVDGNALTYVAEHSDGTPGFRRSMINIDSLELAPAFYDGETLSGYGINEIETGAGSKTQGTAVAVSLENVTVSNTNMVI